MILLSETPEGEKVKIVEIRGGGFGKMHDAGNGCGKGVINRLRAMGIGMGQVVEVLHNPGIGPILVKVGESRIAIGRGMASKILVEKVEGNG